MNFLWNDYLNNLKTFVISCTVVPSNNVWTNNIVNIDVTEHFTNTSTPDIILRF